ncbi:MAG: glycerate kinase [Saprospiraceae bacterium]|nr:glycerate kinase [Saprospiraceae bacterium]
MNLLIACDSFKDSLAAVAVCQALERGIKKADPTCQTQLFPMADGGEGTARIMTYHTQGRWIEVEVQGPLAVTVKAGYGLSADGSKAYIDMAEASGLQLVPRPLRNPLKTGTFGTGQLIQKAIEQGVEKIFLGIGGSATNDGGIGMAKALGYRFLDQNGRDLAGNGEDLQQIAQIIAPDRSFPTIEVLCDVNNPLYGPNGAAVVYGPQKGASEEIVEQLDAGLQQLAKQVESDLSKTLDQIPGAGAAGGMGYGAMVFLNGSLKSGIEAIMNEASFDDALQQADLVITGEGKIDGQTVQGKLIKGICERAKQFNRPVIAVCGALLASTDLIQRIGLQAAFSIQRHPLSLAEALEQTDANLEALGFHLARTLSWNLKTE